jgi:thioredoxin-like negative regulator of GroEL
MVLSLRSVGLFGGPERLPSLAFNTKDQKQIPFSEKISINRDTLTQFCADFISGKLQSAKDAEELAKKQLLAATPLSTKNTPQRKPVKKAPDQVRGVSEQFGDGARGDTAVQVVTAKSFEEVVMDESKDVLVMFHSTSCEACSHFSVYYKRMAQRFKDLSISSLVVARMDVSNESPPGHLNLLVSALPLVVLLPANDKTPPWLYYSGVSKVQTMMKWVEQFASVPFTLPNLPHLSKEDVVLYKEQVREREEHMEEKREQEREAMEAETLKQEQFKKSKDLQREAGAGAGAGAGGGAGTGGEEGDADAEL